MSRSPIPVAVVGVGHLGQHHARLYGELPGSELVGVVDTDRDRAELIAARCGCPVLEDASQLVGRVEAVSVAVPTVHHADVAVPLLEAGIHVLVEKPMAHSLDDADRILDAARRSGSRVMVGHTERFNPAMQALAAQVVEPRFFEIHRLAGFTARSTDIDVVLDLMIHDLDLVLHLDGTEVEHVDAIGVSALTNKLDIANARLRMRSGCVANITASRISAENVRRLRVFQTHAYLSCDTVTRDAESYRLVPGDGGRPAIAHEDLPVEDREPLAVELAAFLDAVAAGESPPVDGEQGRRVLELAFRVGDEIERSLVR